MGAVGISGFVAAVVCAHPPLVIMGPIIIMNPPTNAAGFASLAGDNPPNRKRTSTKRIRIRRIIRCIFFSPQDFTGLYWPVIVFGLLPIMSTFLFLYYHI